MKFSHDFLLKILKSVPASDDQNGTMHIIVQQPYDYLKDEFHGVFGDQDDVELKVDARQEERRKKNAQFSEERRQKDRRTQKDTLVEVVIVG